LPHRIEYSLCAVEHLRALEAPQTRAVLDAVDAQLQHQPTVETRNRKPMRPNPIAPWELRIDDLRVYYEVDAAATIVRILAVGLKDRKVVRIGKEVLEL
jgi:mRNA-degrading endonuclease RelE of RelBE toxin-antitoxin system